MVWSSIVTGGTVDRLTFDESDRKAHLPCFGAGMPVSNGDIVMRRTFTAFLALAGLAASALAADRAGTVPLRSQPLPDLNKVADMITVEYAPGQSTPAHRHNAHVFVYVLEGALVMGSKAGAGDRVGGADVLRIAHRRARGVAQRQRFEASEIPRAAAPRSRRFDDAAGGQVIYGA